MSFSILAIIVVMEGQSQSLEDGLSVSPKLEPLLLRLSIAMSEQEEPKGPI